MGKSWRPEPDGGFDEGIELESDKNTAVRLLRRSPRDRRITNLQRRISSAVPLIMPRDYCDATSDVLLRCTIKRLMLFVDQAVKARDWDWVVIFCESILKHPDLKNRSKTYLILSIAYKNLEQFDKAREACKNGLQCEQMMDSDQARDLQDMCDDLA